MKTRKILTLFTALTLQSQVTFSGTGITTETIFASTFEHGILLPNSFESVQNSLFTEDLLQYIHLPVGANITGQALLKQNGDPVPSWIYLETDPMLSLDGQAQDLGELLLEIQIETDNAGTFSAYTCLNVVESGGGNPNNLPPELVIEARATDIAGDPVAVDTTDPYNVGADYTIHSSDDLFIDATGSIDTDGNIENLKITSDVNGILYDGTLEEVVIPRLGSGTLENLTIEIIDDDGATTTDNKLIARG